MKRVILLSMGVFACLANVVWGVAGYWEIPKTDRDVKVDGLVTPRERSACSVTTFTVVGALKRPQYETTLYSCATQEGIYFGFVCSDPYPQSLITSVTTENGPVMKDDSVELVLCPALVGERDNYFHFAMNAAGVRYSWDASFDRPVQGWVGKAAATPAGWEAEFFIPYSTLRGRKDLSHWRGNFMRTRPARGKEKEEISAWVDPGMTIHNYKKFGFLRFVEPKEESIEELLRQLMELRMQEMKEQSTTGSVSTTDTVTSSPMP
ncbi:MAG: hypothetical protein N2Z21_11180 [Candidatus Sumerlaeaceae bacterium]|nr:hypothetical protein [Candidatus Sumerlaeaceae bacterium]